MIDTKDQKQPTTSNAIPQAALLIATDFSENSQQAALHGFRTATAWGAAPHVVHVCRKTADGLSIQRGPERLLLTPDKGRALLAEHVESLLGHYRSIFGEPGFGIAISHLLAGDPEEVIVGLAKDLRVSLLVVGNSGKDGMRRLLLGSTAEAIVRHAQCPVLVSRPRALSPEELIEPPCAACLEVRQESHGEHIWCAQHLAAQERRHTYHYRDKNARVRENMPLLFPMRG